MTGLWDGRGRRYDLSKEFERAARAAPHNLFSPRVEGRIKEGSYEFDGAANFLDKPGDRPREGEATGSIVSGALVN